MAVSISILWAVKIFNIFSRTSVKLSMVVITWYGFTSYSILFTYVNLRSGFPILAYMCREDYFCYWLNITQGFEYLNVVVLGTQWPWLLYTGIWNLSLATNFQYVYCAYVDFNAVNFLCVVIWYKCTSCNFITSSKIFTLFYH